MQWTKCEAGALMISIIQVQGAHTRFSWAIKNKNVMALFTTVEITECNGHLVKPRIIISVFSFSKLYFWTLQLQSSSLSSMQFYSFLHYISGSWEQLVSPGIVFFFGWNLIVSMVLSSQRHGWRVTLKYGSKNWHSVIKNLQSFQTSHNQDQMGSRNNNGIVWELWTILHKH